MIFSTNSEIGPPKTVERRTVLQENKSELNKLTTNGQIVMELKIVRCYFCGTTKKNWLDYKTPNGEQSVKF